LAKGSRLFKVLSVEGREVEITHPDKLYFSSQTRIFIGFNFILGVALMGKECFCLAVTSELCIEGPVPRGHMFSYQFWIGIVMGVSLVFGVNSMVNLLIRARA
jgi:hypothetical protein